MDDLELLRETRESLARLREREAVRMVLAFHPACSETQLDPAARDVVDRRGRIREEPRQAEGRRRDQGPEAKRRRSRGEPGERRPRVVRDVAGLVRLRDVVVGAEERLDAVRLARVGEVAPLLPGDALLSFDHQCDAHAAILRARVSSRCASLPNSRLVTPRKIAARRRSCGATASARSAGASSQQSPSQTKIADAYSAGRQYGAKSMIAGGSVGWKRTFPVR